MVSMEDYLDKTKPCLSDMRNDHQTQGEWKIELKMVINFFSSKDSKETRTIHSKDNIIEFMIW